MADRRNTNARTPAELRGLARDEERRAQRREGDEKARALRRAAEYFADADKWDAELEATKVATSEHRKAALKSTQNKKDAFTAQYGSGTERDAARRRLGY